jgi:tRNA(Ser,Leu) C12 N-acetylase TAN1
MHDWNIVITIYEHSYARAFKLLEPFGTLAKTDYFNVLAMKVTDIKVFINQLKNRIIEDPSVLESIARVVPVNVTFSFQMPDEFETKAREAVQAWIPDLVGKTFHVRMHRRGFKGRLSSQDEERFLDHFLIEQTKQHGEAARISFDDPDYIIALETIGQQAGLSMWSRADREELHWLNLN